MHLRRDLARLEANLGHLAIALGDPAQALVHIQKALDLHVSGVALDAHVDTLCLHAQAALDLGALDIAAGALSSASSPERALSGPYDESHVGWLCGRLAAMRSNPHGSLAVLERALERARTGRVVGFITVILAERASALEKIGARARAAEEARECIELLGRPGGADFAAEAYESLASVSGVREQFVASARPWLAVRLERAGAERELLSRHSRLLRISAALV